MNRREFISKTSRATLVGAVVLPAVVPYPEPPRFVDDIMIHDEVSDNHNHVSDDMIPVIIVSPFPSVEYLRMGERIYCFADDTFYMNQLGVMPNAGLVANLVEHFSWRVWYASDWGLHRVYSWDEYVKVLPFNIYDY